MSSIRCSPPAGIVGGSGLGMSIAHGIVQEHQGRMEVQSREGMGTTVIIDLPAAAGSRRTRRPRRAWQSWLEF